MLAPFRPSPTIAQPRAEPVSSRASSPRDIRVIAGAVTGRRDWPTVRLRRASRAGGSPTASAMPSSRSRRWRTDATRPRYRGRMVHAAAHAPFIGYNRAQAAVLEAAILSTRLHMLAPDKVLAEMAYLAIAHPRRPGPREREAWGWIEDKVAAALGPRGPHPRRSRRPHETAARRDVHDEEDTLGPGGHRGSGRRDRPGPRPDPAEGRRRSIEINAPADKVWAVIGNFKDMSWLPNVDEDRGHRRQHRRQVQARR